MCSCEFLNSPRISCFLYCICSTSVHSCDLGCVVTVFFFLSVRNISMGRVSDRPHFYWGDTFQMSRLRFTVIFLSISIKCLLLPYSYRLTFYARLLLSLDALSTGQTFLRKLRICQLLTNIGRVVGKHTGFDSP